MIGFQYPIFMILIIILSYAPYVCFGVSETKTGDASDTIYHPQAIFHPVVARNGMVSSQQRLASLEGLKVLKEGGNAVDAAVTTAFTLAVTLPRAGNIGGGGFMLINSAKDKNIIAIDYREKAPLGAFKDMFLDDEGNVNKQKSRASHLASGVPGTVHGLVLALEKYGTIPLKRALAPAIHYAENGFSVNHGLADSLKSAHKAMQRSKASLDVFYDGAQQRFYRAGDILVQKDLAKTLKAIAEKGKDVFYRGWIAKRIAGEMRKNGGLITLEDLEAYEAKIRTPVHGTYRGYDIYSMSPPSSGGVHIIQMLNMLENYPRGFWGHNSARTIHLMAEVMKRAYADRSKYLGDPDFVKIPIDGLISKEYAKLRIESIDLRKASPATTLFPGNPIPYESNETTHFSIIDNMGNAVSNTYTLNFPYGSGITVPGTGILLNNQMDDFSAKDGVPNAYGLIGGRFNAIEPQKRMLSSMSPTIVLKDGKLFLITGSPGGGRIINTTLQILLNVIDHRMNIAEATNAPRIHHQWLPDEIRIEKGIGLDTRSILRTFGHKAALKDSMGSTQSIMFEEGRFFGSSDPRRSGALTIGY
uniref:Glutathione hydrolase proenzyme n=1 Tax=Candidatus Kentrum sp. TUN TaxID=2126343 RepID=A0A450ZV04_9GAMM|nr:MAG: gamma-glutamyltransferase 1 . Threonine peptidase. MEROPS family T03 [Candidatus Kentron sp. TUN]VFK57620.1 MAG: gamma-glutamyltransferase 1 . Threonine peptidase. MEROPS family T03 [Candidatus Kentron sp. TUN]